jgi:cation:H+ antiporter
VPAILYPTFCNQDSLPRDTAIMLAATVSFGFLCFLGPIGQIQGALMFAAMLFLVVRTCLRERGNSDAEAAAEQELERVLGLPTRRRMIALFLILGTAGLPLGAQLMVDGAVQLAQSAGVSDAAIGLSVIALGTSLPELATTVVAALHRHSDVALGNVLGSNLFNILGIMGITAVVAPQAIPVPPSILQFDLFVMLGAALVLSYFAFSRRTIDRRAGIALVAGYVFYIAAVFSLSARPAIAAAAH